MYLFSNCGTAVCRKPGKMYNKCDFDKFVCSSDFVFYNRHGEGVCVIFPVYMYSYVKCIRLNTNIDYCETLLVRIIKKR